jgi:ELWxxDGT repeat protein
MKLPLIKILSLGLFNFGLHAAEIKALQPFIDLSSEALAGAVDLPIPKTDTHPVEWANPGSLGPTGMLAQRSMTRLEYKILSVEDGSPAHDRILPGDVVIGTDGGLFQPEDYSKEHPSVAKYNRFMEPNVALGQALEIAAAQQDGRLVLSVRRGEKEGTVTLQLPFRRSFSKTYPWDCERSEQVAEEIAARFSEARLPFKNDLYATAWYGLFLLNHDPIRYRGKIDEIVQLVLGRLPSTHSGSPIRGYGGGTWVWQTSLYGTFLAEYAMITNQGEVMRPHLDLVADLLFDVRMVGNLWGHSKWHNYGRTSGGFVAASSQAALALHCLKQAGASIDESSLGKVMDGLSTSIDRRTGQVGYGSPDHGGASKEFDWDSIGSDKSQLGAESMMRQGAVQLAMLLNGRTDEARAASLFMERMRLSHATHATHGITPDWGFLDASRALASTDPAACRARLDTIRYRLNLCLRWDGGLQIVPYRNRRGEEYGVDTFKADRYAPAMWGLILSMPKKRLFLLSHVAKPEAVVKLPPSSTFPIPGSMSVRHLVCGAGKDYFAAPDGLENWGVYEHEFESGATRLLMGGFRSSPHELILVEDMLYFSVPGDSVWVWDGEKARQLLERRSGGGRAAAQFTPFDGVLYFVSPPERKKGQGGELWKTDGTKDGTVKVKDDLWMLLGGNKGWQSDVAHAQSMRAALGKLFFATCEVDSTGRPDNGTFSLWASDGSEEGTTRLVTARLDVVAVDNSNSPRGSYLGVEFQGKLYFSANKKLWESDGTVAGTRVSPLGIRSPNNLSLFKDRLLLSGQRSSVKSRKRGLQLISTDGSSKGTMNFNPGVKSLRQITTMDDSRFLFIADDGIHGNELWVSDGSSENTRMVRDLNPGPYGGLIDNLICLKGRLYFSASEGVYGNEIWRTNGSSTGTEVFDLVPGSAGCLPEQLRVSDGKLHFYTTAISKGRQLWRFDPLRHKTSFKRPGVNRSVRTKPSLQPRSHP